MRSPAKAKGPISTATTDIEKIRLHLAVAMKTMRLMPHRPGDRPMAVQSSWIGFDQSSRFLSGRERQPIRQKATPRQIRHMEYWLDAVLKLDEEGRRIAMARACRISWRRLEEIDGRSHTTLRKIERKALAMLAEHLADGAVILPPDGIL